MGKIFSQIPNVVFHCIGGQWNKGKFVEGKLHGFMFDARVWDKPQVNGFHRAAR